MSRKAFRSKSSFKMKLASARRTASRGNGPSAARARASRPISATRMPISSARSVPRAARARRSLCPSPTLPPCSFISMKSRAMSPWARTPSCCSTAPDGIRPESSMCGKHHPDLAAFPFARTEPSRERLAISARQLALEPRLRNLRRHHRRRLRRMAQTDRPATDDHLNRNARSGAYRSNIMTFGITPRAASQSKNSTAARA